MRIKPRFVLDVFDASDNRLGPGPLADVQQVMVTEELDRIGKLAFTVPVPSDRARDLLTLGRQVQVRTDEGNVAARGYITKITFTADRAGRLLYRVEGVDRLWELTWRTTGYNRVYDNADVKTAIIGEDGMATSLLGGTGWTQGSVEDYGATTISFDAQTRFNALLQLARQLGRHIRQGEWGSRTLDFGLFGSDSGVRLINVHGAGVTTGSSVGLFSTIAVDAISADIENRLFPLGKNKFDLRDAPGTCTEIKVTPNGGPTGAQVALAVAATAGDTTITLTDASAIAVDDELWIGDPTDWTQPHEMVSVQEVNGSDVTLWTELENDYAAGTAVILRPQFYVEDTASQSTYGLREACPQFGWIGPGSSSAEESLQVQAARTLYLAAQARLTRYANEYRAYTLGDVVGLEGSTLRVGQKVRITYRGVVNAFGGQVYEEVDGDFVVLKVTRRWTGDGRFTMQLGVASTDRPMPNNEALVLFNLDTGRWVTM